MSSANDTLFRIASVLSAAGFVPTETNLATRRGVAQRWGGAMLTYETETRRAQIYISADLRFVVSLQIFGEEHETTYRPRAAMRCVAEMLWWLTDDASMRGEDD